MTQRQAAVAGKITRVMQHAARAEQIDPEVLRQGLADGTLVIPANKRHKGLQPIAIGSNVRVKVNANIGTSPHDISWRRSWPSWPRPWSTGPTRSWTCPPAATWTRSAPALLAQCPAPFGTVPIYQVMTEAKSLDDVKADDLLDMVHHHARQGVDFVTVHCGVTASRCPS
jgi:phosphomethylpyrimidine synthase